MGGQAVRRVPKSARVEATSGLEVECIEHDPLLAANGIDEGSRWVVVIGNSTTVILRPAAERLGDTVRVQRSSLRTRFRALLKLA